MKGCIGLRRKIIAFDRYKSYFYLLRHKEKIVKKTYTDKRSVYKNLESV